MIDKLGILGAGGQAAELADYLDPDVPAFYAVGAAYIPAGASDVIDLDTTDPAHISVPVIAAVGAPAVRREMVNRWGGDEYATVISDRAYVAPTAAIGAGCVISPLSAVGSRSAVGNHIIVNLGATVSHDCTVEDFATVSPGAHIAGNCTIGAGAFIGIGATVINGVTIAPGTVIGAGAVVIEDTVENGVYVGVPARLISVRDEWLRHI
jgi:sugar O-acyltransferase (sialic acid O-acetyltransferase NeuD family)